MHRQAIVMQAFTGLVGSELAGKTGNGGYRVSTVEAIGHAARVAGVWNPQLAINHKLILITPRLQGKKQRPDTVSVLVGHRVGGWRPLVEVTNQVDLVGVSVYVAENGAARNQLGAATLAVALGRATGRTTSGEQEYNCSASES